MFNILQVFELLVSSSKYSSNGNKYTLKCELPLRKEYKKIETLENRGQNVNSTSEIKINTVKFFTKPVRGK